MLQEEAKKRQATSGPGLLGAKPLVVERPQAVPDNDFKELQGRTREIAAKVEGNPVVPVPPGLRPTGTRGGLSRW